MADILSLDDLAYGLRRAQPPGLRKTGATMEGVGNWLHSKWYEAGCPGAGVAPSAGINGAALTSDPTPVTGQVHFTKAAAGNVCRLAGLWATASQAGALHVYDRLWANSGIGSTTTTAQAIAALALPARDADGATSGEGVKAALEVSSATGNVGAITNCTISYTNSDGTAGRTGTIDSFPATAAVGTLVPFNLQAGDRGVRSYQSITLGTSLVSGTVHLVLYREIAVLPFDAAGTRRAAWDEIGIPQLFDGCVPWLLWSPLSTTAVDLTAGRLMYAEK